MGRRHDRLRYQPDVLKRLVNEYKYQLKFVIASPADMGEVTEYGAELNAKPENVILMPEGTQVDTLRERGIWLTEICKQHGYRYGPRLHIDLWGDRRGI